jgi:phosphoenolpyruvate-protein phosphotransferase (PTS system enzyme I)
MPAMPNRQKQGPGGPERPDDAGKRAESVRGTPSGDHSADMPQDPAIPASTPTVIKGVGVSAGIVVGRALYVDDDPHRVVKRAIAPAAVKAELARFEAALKASMDEINFVHKKAEKEMGKDAAKIFLFHHAMLQDKTVLGPIRRMIEDEHVNAEYAISHTFQQYGAKFLANPDSVFATKVNDLDDLSARLISHLIGRQDLRLKNLPDNTILFAGDLTPSQTAAFDRTKVLGFATALGGRTGHTAIVAKALGIPAVVGCKMLLADDGATVILDGDEGVVIINPSREQLDEYRRLQESRRNFQLSLAELADAPAITLDGTPIELLGNIEFPDEVKGVVSAGGTGIGLYRTEFLHLTRSTEPTEGDHFQAYKRCIDQLGGRMLTIRTLDLGADKYTQERGDSPERNPFLGLRSIRYSLANQPMFKKQLRAILRASGLPGVAPGAIKVMFPLVTSVTEFRQAKYLVNDVMEDLEEEGHAFDASIKLGMMVEVPSAAILADAFASQVDFFSIGTNDLVQYTLAVDRTNENVAHLYNPNHPAVLRLIREVVKAARRYKIPVSCCGEQAAEIEYAVLLLGLGLRTLSVTGSSIPPLKRLIRSVNLQACQRLAKQALTMDSEVQVTTMLRERVRKIVPDAFGGRARD